MYGEHCIDVYGAKIIGGHTEGEALKLDVLSFLGDIDSRTGVVVSEDTNAKGQYVKDRVLIVKKFRGSTVGVYILYSLCKNGLAPKAIVSEEPDPVVIAGVVLCNITGVFKVPRMAIVQIENGDMVRIEPLENGVKICVVKG